MGPKLDPWDPGRAGAEDLAGLWQGKVRQKKKSQNFLHGFKAEEVTSPVSLESGKGLTGIPRLKVSDPDERLNLDSCYVSLKCPEVIPDWNR